MATGMVAVTTGERPVLLTPNRDGRVELDHTDKASVMAVRPDAARVEGDTTITLQTPSGSTVIVATRSWVTQRGMTRPTSSRPCCSDLMLARHTTQSKW
jgi:hypothetical protein